MSQAKVDAYKEEKANRQSKLEAEKKAKKRNKIITRAIEIALAGALVAALVVTCINLVSAEIAKRPNYYPEEYVLGDFTALEATEEDGEGPADDSVELPADNVD